MSRIVLVCLAAIFLVACGDDADEYNEYINEYNTYNEYNEYYETIMLEVEKRKSLAIKRKQYEKLKKELGE